MAKRTSTTKHSCFTLLEVMVAALILTMGAMMTLAIVGTARGQILRAERRWAVSHVMSQAAELFLLAGQDATPPPDMLPEGFTAACNVQIVDDLPEDTPESPNGWPNWRLGVYHISVTNSFGEVVANWSVEKLILEEDAY